MYNDTAGPDAALLPHDCEQLVERTLKRKQLLDVGVGCREGNDEQEGFWQGGGRGHQLAWSRRGDRETRLTVANDLARVVEGLDETSDATWGGENVHLDLGGPVGEEDAEELEREEAEVEVVRGE